MATLTTSQFYSVKGKQPIINAIQEDDPSYDPLGAALEKSKVSIDLFNAACDRVYFDGYYGPVRDEEWEEQDGREPYSVKEAINIIAHVLDEIDDYNDNEAGYLVGAGEIRAEIIYWYREIYGVGYPSV